MITKTSTKMFQSAADNSKLLVAWALFFFISSTSSVTHGQDAEKFRWKLNAGDEFTVQLVQDTKIKSNIDQRVQEMANKMTLDMDWKVTDVNDDNTATIAQTITRIRLQIVTPNEGGSQTIAVDTQDTSRQKELAKRLHKQVIALIDTKYNVSMSDRGGLLGVEIPKASLEALRGAPSSLQLRKVLTEDGLKDLFGQSAIVFPENELAKGDDWDSTAKVENSLGVFEKKNVYKYAGPENGSHRFNIATELNQTADGKAGSKVISFAGSGQLMFNVDAGHVTESTITNKMNTENNSYKETTINTVIDSKVSMKVNRK